LYRYTLVWWAEGSLGDFFTDASPPAGALARGAAAGAVDRSRGPAMTPDGFAAVLHLGVGLCKLSAVDPQLERRLVLTTLEPMKWEKLVSKPLLLKCNLHRCIGVAAARARGATAAAAAAAGGGGLVHRGGEGGVRSPPGARGARLVKYPKILRKRVVNLVKYPKHLKTPTPPPKTPS
jgi:hypothetical protein